MHDDVEMEVVLVHTPEVAQKVAQSSPDSFNGVGVDFPNSVAIVIAGSLFP